LAAESRRRRPTISTIDHQLCDRELQMSGARILLVEDEPRLQKVLALTLEQSGYDVKTASTAAEAMQAVSEDRPGVLVLDVNLPDGTGWGVLRQLASQGITCDMLPTIVLSAGQPAQHRIAEFRPRAFLAKPFPVDALKRLIAEALNNGPGPASGYPASAAG
jgi:DNA-binding response OmpR family regulator